MRLYPDWLKKKIIIDHNSRKVQGLLDEKRVHTVCVSARCPNKGECFSKKCAAFLILGDVCTRRCIFCAVSKGIPDSKVDEDEKEKILKTVKEMGLTYVVITSVTRDDLPDGGAKHFHDIIMALRQEFPEIRVEVLVPDFKGSMVSLKTVLEAMPEVLNHNIETVRSLYPMVRPGADYERSLDLLTYAKEYSHGIIKSGVMLGMGEKEEEIIQTFRDIKETGCDILTIGQYLKPSIDNYTVKKFVSPCEFEYYKEEALFLGFRSVVSGPFVRSSYQAAQFFEKVSFNFLHEKNPVISCS